MFKELSKRKCLAIGPPTVQFYDSPPTAYNYNGPDKKHENDLVLSVSVVTRDRPEKTKHTEHEGIGDGLSKRDHSFPAGARNSGVFWTLSLYTK